jgi:hypothetical protein
LGNPSPGWCRAMRTRRLRKPISRIDANLVARSNTPSSTRPLAMPVPLPPTPCSALPCARTGLS